MSGRYLFGRLPVQWRWGEVMFAALVGGGELVLYLWSV